MDENCRSRNKIYEKIRSSLFVTPGTIYYFKLLFISGDNMASTGPKYVQYNLNE